MSTPERADLTRFVCLAYGRDFTLWVYLHAGHLDAALAPGFFDGTENMVANGDHVHVRASYSGALVQIVHAEGRVLAVKVS